MRNRELEDHAVIELFWANVDMCAAVLLRKTFSGGGGGSASPPGGSENDGSDGLC